MYLGEPANMTPAQREAWLKSQDQFMNFIFYLFMLIPVIAFAGACLDGWLHGH